MIKRPTAPGTPKSEHAADIGSAVKDEPTPGATPKRPSVKKEKKRLSCAEVDEVPRAKILKAMPTTKPTSGSHPEPVHYNGG